MNAAQAHRGPDATGQWQAEGIGLGHTRLAILDLSAAGNQPMSDASGRYVLAFNGEIYNYATLRTELHSYPFRTQTDTEVILAAFSCWGPEAFARLEGMFAFALWDAAERRLWLVRDPLGIKPLYYAYRPERGQLAFASELRALLAAGLAEARLDDGSLANYLRYQTVHTPRTILADVAMLPPGSWLSIDDRGTQQRRYWQPKRRPEYAQLSPAEWPKRVREALAGAVADQMVADVPFGAFLSGGIDSSAIVALMAQVARAPVKTFTVTFDEAAYDESAYAALVAKRYGTEHCDIRLQPRDFLALLPSALDAMDHPSGDGPNTYVVAQATKAAGITMALSGLGSDELFGGYALFRQLAQLESRVWLRQMPVPLRRWMGAAAAALQPSVSNAKIAAILSASPLRWHTAYPVFRQVFLEAQVKELLTHPQPAANRVAHWIETRMQQDALDQWPLLSQISQAEFYTYMQDVLLRDTDQMTMAHALEVRVPFLDTRLVELVLNAPDALKLAPGPKPLLVSALAGYLPEAVVNRPKMGFTLPFERWMRHELHEFCASRLSQLAERPQFNAQAIHRLWKAFSAGDPRLSWSRIWTLVVLSHWLNKNGVK